MNRLTDIYNGTLHNQIVYDPLGRMTAKQADGQAVFANASFDAAPGQPAQPHAIKCAETAEGVFPAAQQQITYTAFDKVKSISEDGNGLIVNYGYDQQRIWSYLMTSDNRFINKDYVGLCEYNTEYFVDGGAIQTTFTYLVGPYGVFAVVENNNNTTSTHYILKDHLGSWTTITDSEGNVEQEIAFDAWGNLRDPETWLNYPTDEPAAPLMFDRGFTGHEHMTRFGLINMNGRCYDPLTSSFLSVDAYVQDPTNAQGFNRYAYCSHNPLRYTDPTGWYQQTGSGYNINPKANLIGTTTYQSDDPCDMLWGRTVHPCDNGSSGFINRIPCTTTGYSEGNNGLIGCNYTVDRKGYVKNVGENGQTFDVLYSADAYASGDLKNGIIVEDLSLLNGLTEIRKDYSYRDENWQYCYGNYSTSFSLDETFKVYYFMIHNTDVEWEINGFRTSGLNEYIINTTHFETRVKQITTSNNYSDYDLIFRMHNHTLVDGTKGASGNKLKGDMSVIIDLHEKQFINKDIHQWHVINGVITKFPSHYVYHNATSVLYHYTPNKSSIYIRQVNTYKDLYRNLGF